MNYKLYLVIVALIPLFGCGSSPTTILPAGTQVIQTNGNVSYTLTATSDPNGSHPATSMVASRASVTMPKILSALSNASWIGRADLVIGQMFCSYQSDGQGVYVRLDGSCNTFTPDNPITVNAGDTVSLMLEVCSNGPASVEATVSGVSI